MSQIAPTPNEMIRQSLPSLSRMAQRLNRHVATWKTRRRSREDLSQLDAHMLNDIGIDPIAADAEARKPFWRV